MKNRILPSGLLAAFVGLSFLLITAVSVAGTPGKTGKTRWDRIRVNQHTGTVDMKDIVKARQQLNDLATKTTSALNLNWQSMGPTNFAGEMRSVIYDNTDQTGQRIYAASANGGIWKSSNNGLTWEQALVEGNLVPKFSSLVQTASGTIYAATGITACGEYEFAGTGLYMSIGGNPFVLVPGTLTDPDWTTCARLAVSPTNGRLYAATFGGLLYSDNGNDWTKALPGYASDVVVGPDGTVLATVGYKGYLAVAGEVSNFVNISTGEAGKLPYENVSWATFAIAPSDGNIMYACLIDSVGYMRNTYRSGDKGASWSVIFPANDSYDPFSANGCQTSAIIVFPNDPNRILLGGNDMWEGEMIQPTGYYNWEQVSFGSITTLLDPQYVPSMHHQYVFNPKSPTQFAIATDGGISVGTAGATAITYKTSAKNLLASRFNSVCGTYRTDFIMGGADFIGTQNIGYYYPAFLNNPHDGFPVWVEVGLAEEGGDGGSCEWSTIDPNVIIYTKIGDSSQFRRQDLRDLTYVNFFRNYISNDMVDIIPMRLWESFSYTINPDSVKYINLTDFLIPANTLITAKSYNVQFPFEYVTPVDIPIGDSIMVPDYVATRFFVAGTATVAGGATLSGVFMTKDALNFAKDPSYFMIMRDNIATPSTDPISTIGISNDGNTVWAGTEKGRLVRISNLALAHDSATADQGNPTCIVSNEFFTELPFSGQFVTAISVNPKDPTKMMVTVGNFGNNSHVYYCSNALDSLPIFTSAQGNLPQIPVFTGIIELHADGNALVGTDFGVFSTNNLDSGSPSWTLETANIGDVTVTELRQQTLADFHISNLGEIFAASYGHGLFMDTTHLVVGIEPPQGGSTAHAGSIQIYPNPVNDIATLTFTNETAGDVQVVVYDLAGRTAISKTLGSFNKGKQSASLNLSDLNAGSYLVKIGNAYGKIVKR